MPWRPAPRRRDRPFGRFPATSVGGTRTARRSGTGAAAAASRGRRRFGLRSGRGSIEALTAFNFGRIARSTAPMTSGRTSASRSRPRGPRAGASPGPKGGASGELIGSGKGATAAHGRPDPSATASAPQGLTSRTMTSGSTASMADLRSAASCSARATKTDVPAASDALAPFAFQSSWRIASICPSIGAA